jgi:dihydrofolate reductase
MHNHYIATIYTTQQEIDILFIMKVTLWMAISANGLIATKDGKEDFLSHDNWVQFVQCANRIGCLIWGRKTYEAVSKWDKKYLDDLLDVKKIIVSHAPQQLPEGFTSATSPEDALHQLESAGCAEVMISGGSTLNSEFAKLGLINEVRLDINSVIIGEGIPVLAPAEFALQLKLWRTEWVSPEIIELVYQVV